MSYFLYLHGWGSSPSSHKALFFQKKIPFLQVPDLNQADFYALTLSRQLGQVQNLLAERDDITLIASSFGALTALWLAERNPCIRRLVLLAPALNFSTNVERMLGASRLQQWRAQGDLMVYHAAWAKEILLSYEFIEDLRAYPDTGLRHELPTLICHGRNDETILHADVAHFCVSRPWIDLRVYADDHSLTASLLEIWPVVQNFCQIPEIDNSP
jgi:uncharacterized protein